MLINFCTCCRVRISTQNTIQTEDRCGECLAGRQRKTAHGKSDKRGKASMRLAHIAGFDLLKQYRQSFSDFAVR